LFFTIDPSEKSSTANLLEDAWLLKLGRTYLVMGVCLLVEHTDGFAS